MNDSKIKILHVTFNMGIGGTEQVIRQIIQNSDNNRFTHEVLCIDGEIGALGKELDSWGIRVSSIKRSPGIDLDLVKLVRRMIRDNDVNVVHCHQYTPYFYGVLGACFTRAKVVFTEHGRFYPDRHNFKRRFVNPVLSWMTAQITAISESTRCALSEYEYINKGRIKVIYNGIKKIERDSANREGMLTELGLVEDGSRYVGTISRLEPIKNQAMMIQAFNIVKKQTPDLRLILIGDGAIAGQLKALTNELGLEDDVIFTGYIDNPQRYISLFEIFLLSSFSEGASMTLLEAMSLFRPCVVTDVGGNPEIVLHEETGIVVPSDDAEKFSEAMIRMLNDENKRRAFGEAGHVRFTRNFTARHMVDIYQGLYNELRS